MTVVDGSLVENLLREWHRGRLELDEHERLHESIIDNRVATFRFTCYFDGHFYRNKIMRIGILIYQKLQGGLAHKFLWRETNESSSPRTENILFAVFFSSYLYITFANCLSTTQCG